MRELKVQCDCGQKFKFDVEPVNNQMPFTVTCPVCAKDETEKANTLLRAQSVTGAAPISISAPQPVAPVPILTMAAPAPAPVSLTPAAPPAAEQPRLRINAAAHAETAPPPAPIAPPMPFGAPPPSPGPAAKAKSKGEFNLTLGIVGAVVGGLVGMVAWYYFIKLTNYESGWVATGVGFLAGIGARVMGRGGNTTLGVVAAICALLAMLGGRYWLISGMISQAQASMSNTDEFNAAYDSKVELGKAALTAQTDDEIKALYKKDNDLDPTDDELAAYKAKDLPELRDFASGKITREQFINDEKAKTQEIQDQRFTFKMRWLLFKMSFDTLTFVIMAIGVASAYRIATR